MAKCRFDLTTELKCGLDSKGPLCPLHDNNSVSIGELIELASYVETSPQIHDGVLYLTNQRFYGIEWAEVLEGHYGVINFSGSKFKDCEFHGMIFRGPAYFVGSSFVDTDFAAVTFKSGADFSETWFDGKKIAFDHCTFKTDYKEEVEQKPILFVRTVFEGPLMPFPACSISGLMVSFEGATFECHALRIRVHRSGGDAWIRQYLSISSDKINLTDLSFTGHFLYTQHPKSKSFAPRLDLQLIMFSSMASVAFVEANLERARFTYSVIDNVNFINCAFGTKLSWMGDLLEKWGMKLSLKRYRRKIIYDDLSPVPDVSKWEVLRQYIQLKKNFENQKDFVGAGDWSYREMECRRKLADKFFYKMGMRCYAWSASYGEYFLTPLLWLLGVWMVAAAGYLMAGIPLDNNGKMLNYDLCSEGAFLLSDIIIALKFSAMAMSLQLGKSVDLMAWGGTYIYIPHLILTISLVSLFLLALRRKFRR